MTSQMLIQISDEIDNKKIIPQRTHMHLQMPSAFVWGNLQKLSMKAFASATLTCRHSNAL
jgi:hypothetical protein